MEPICREIALYIYCIWSSCFHFRSDKSDLRSPFFVHCPNSVQETLMFSLSSEFQTQRYFGADSRLWSFSFPPACGLWLFEAHNFCKFNARNLMVPKVRHFEWYGASVVSFRCARYWILNYKYIYIYIIYIYIYIYIESAGTCWGSFSNSISTLSPVLELVSCLVGQQNVLFGYGAYVHWLPICDISVTVRCFKLQELHAFISILVDLCTQTRLEAWKFGLHRRSMEIHGDPM